MVELTRDQLEGQLAYAIAEGKEVQAASLRREIAALDPWQWLHDNGFSWDDVNAMAAILEAGGFDIAPDGLKEAAAAIGPWVTWSKDGTSGKVPSGFLRTLIAVSEAHGGR